MNLYSLCNKNLLRAVGLGVSVCILGTFSGLKAINENADNAAKIEDELKNKNWTKGLDALTALNGQEKAMGKLFANLSADDAAKNPLREPYQNIAKSAIYNWFKTNVFEADDKGTVVATVAGGFEKFKDVVPQAVHKYVETTYLKSGWLKQIKKTGETVTEMEKTAINAKKEIQQTWDESNKDFTTWSDKAKELWNAAVLKIKGLASSVISKIASTVKLDED